MQRSAQPGFEASYSRHLPSEQRRAVLEALANEVAPDATVGDILDAAESLGWGEDMGEFSLGELAAALLEQHANQAKAAAQTDSDGSDVEASSIEDDLDEDEDDLERQDLADNGEDEDEYEEYDEEEEEYEEEEEEYEEEEEEPPPRRAKKKAAKKSAKKKAAKKSAKKKAAKKSAKKKAAKKSAKKKAAKKSSTTSKAKSKKKAAKSKSKTKSGGRGRAARLRALKRKIDAEERMSLDEAAELLVPIVEELGEATMQDIEETTQIGRRKLRFHIGQLVRHEHLERHGMGRGTHYTVAQ